jgi:hypothetical protein
MTIEASDMPAWSMAGVEKATGDTDARHAILALAR